MKKIKAFEPWVFIFFGDFIYIGFGDLSTESPMRISGLEFWRELILKMFDISASYWNVLWGFFIVLGGLSLALGIYLLRRKLQKSE